ncbi:MAG: 1-acyl-sn-glycerol-3-phosphate acyltransferase [Microgenomates group bacterium]
MQQLDENPTLPALIFYNHQTGDDPLIIAYILLKYLFHRKNVIMPTSYDYWQLLGSQPHYAITVRLAQKILGWQMVPIIQSYRIRGAKDIKKQSQSEHLTKNFINLLNKKIPQGATIAIAPEGHRSRTGKLLPAEKGLGFITRLMERINGLVLPIAFRYPKGINYGLNFNPRIPTGIMAICGPLMEVGEVVGQASQLTKEHSLPTHSLSEKITNFLMWQLAQNLPEQMQGVYHPSLFLRTLSGDFYLKTNEQTKKVGVWDNKLQSFLPDIY